MGEMGRGFVGKGEVVLGRKGEVGRNGSGRNEKWAKMKLVKMAKGQDRY